MPSAQSGPNTSGMPPDGWYPDPSGRFLFRYWANGAWTQHVSRNGEVLTDPEAITTRLTTDAAADVAADAGGRSSASAPATGEKQPGVFARYRVERQERADQREAFEALAMRAAAGDAEALGELPAAMAEARHAWRAHPLEAKAWQVLAAAARNVISDDVTTQAEEQHLHALAAALGLAIDQLPRRDFALFEELVIAGINDGRFPTLKDPPMILKRGETAYAAFDAALMKEVAVREFRGGSSSVSIPIGFGVRYRVGGVRGSSVVVGTQLATEDSGPLVVTSARTVFTGQKKTLEFRHDRLVGLQEFTDGLRLNVSNRQTASLFKMPKSQSPSIACALIAAATARL